VDGIVRGTARNLRFKLDEYYRTEGAGDQVVIDLPKGGYLPAYRYNPRYHPAENGFRHQESDVHGADPAPPAEMAVPSASPVGTRKPLLVVAGLLGAFAVLAAAGYLIRVRPAAPPVSVVVLPFENRTGRFDAQYIANGITDELTDTLVRIPGLRVIARASARAAGNRGDDLRSIGAELGVETVLTGNLESSGEHIRVSARLASTRDSSLLWSGTFETEGRDLAPLERRIVESAARNLKVAPPPILPGIDTESAEAHDLYAQGRYLWYQFDVESLHRSITFFRQALQKDPGYALAYVGLADAYAILGANSHMPASEALPKAEMAAARALTISPDSGAAHASLGLIKNAEWDWEGGARELQRALELNPGYAPTYQRLALQATVHGRFQEAENLLRQAQTLDPLSKMIGYSLAENAFYARRYDAALAYADRNRQASPAGAADLDFRIYVVRGMLPEARTALARFASFPGQPSLFVEGGRASLMGPAGARRLREILAAPHDGMPTYYYFIASTAALVADRDLAFEWLEKAYTAHDPDLASLRVDPQLDPIRADPRYRVLLKKMGLE
jgi:TolB-like protein/Tfp pilus assembly protein PilF